jgi:chorismate-pyruvate lyase
MNRSRIFAASCALALGACVSAPSRDYVARVELLALLQTLNAQLLSHDSATLTLERWCDEHRLADPARIVAKRVRDEDKPATMQLRELLKVSQSEPLRYRHVQLTCGTHVLSEADNWYVPARLTPEMNRELDETDTPFGKVVKPLGFQRRTLSADLLWEPLPHGWELQPAHAPRERAAPTLPHELLRHRAVLYTAAQQPFSAVVETYTSELFAFRTY